MEPSPFSTDFHFADAIIMRCRALGHPLCVGLDPHLDLIPQSFHQGTMKANDPLTVKALEAFFDAVLEGLGDRVAVVKPQIAFFEQLGWRGLALLEALVQKYQDAGLMVLMDAKRGDIGSTAKAYARTFFGNKAPLKSQALTINPYLGMDSIQPFWDAAQKDGAGLFVLAKTSNPGAADFQDQQTQAGDLFFETVCQRLQAPAEHLAGPKTGWSLLGIVAGATKPQTHARMRELLPKSLFLVPGYGAQGGGAKDALAGFIDGPNGLEGGLVNSSRGVLFPKCQPGETWHKAFERSLQQTIEDLGACL